MKESQKKLSSGLLPETSGFTAPVSKKMIGKYKKSASALVSPDKRWRADR
jgi:hypothetical protein